MTHAASATGSTPHQPRVLVNGDKLRLGETTLHFLLG